MVNSEAVCLNRVAEVIPGIADLRDVNGNYQYALYQPTSFSETGMINELQFFQREEMLSDKLILKPGDVLMKRLNPNFVLLISETGTASTVSQNLFIIRPGSEIHPAYLGYLLEQKDVLSQIEQLSGSSAAIKAISQKKLLDVVLELVPMEQQRIIGELWLLGKKHKQLLQQLIIENDKLLASLYGAVLNNGGK